MITGTTPFREISFSLRVNFSPFGPKAGLSVQVIVMAMTKAIIITIPGMIPAINRLPTEFSGQHGIHNESHGRRNENGQRRAGGHDAVANESA